MNPETRETFFLAVLATVAVGSLVMLSALLWNRASTSNDVAAGVGNTLPTIGQVTAPTKDEAPQPSVQVAAVTVTAAPDPATTEPATTEPPTTEPTSTQATSTVAPLGDDRSIFAGATEPAQLCAAGESMVFGGYARDDTVLVALCGDGAQLDYVGLELPRRLGIRVPACQVRDGLWAADNQGWVYHVASEGTAPGTAVSLTAPGNRQQFNYAFNTVLGDISARTEYTCAAS